MLTPTILFALASIALFLVGLAVGWFVVRLRGDYTKPPIQTTIALLITIVWVIAIAAEILLPAYTVSLMIHGIMGTVVGYLFSEDGLTINIGPE